LGDFVRWGFLSAGRHGLKWKASAMASRTEPRLTSTTSRKTRAGRWLTRLGSLCLLAALTATLMAMIRTFYAIGGLTDEAARVAAIAGSVGIVWAVAPLSLLGVALLALGIVLRLCR
jgi:hypothetical protein